jgi:hypothetical protein
MTAEIIYLPKITAAPKIPPDISAADIVLLFLSVLRMAKENLSPLEYRELKKHIL